MDAHEYNILVKAGVYPAPDPTSQAMDSVGGFMTMVETVVNGNKRWTMYEIIHQWCLTSFREDIEDEPEFVNHTIGRLMAHLIMQGHRRFKVVTPRKFIPIYKYVMSDEWWDATDRKVRRTVLEFTELFNIIPYQYTATKEKPNV